MWLMRKQCSDRDKAADTEKYKRMDQNDYGGPKKHSEPEVPGELINEFGYDIVPAQCKKADGTQRVSSQADTSFSCITHTCQADSVYWIGVGVDVGDAPDNRDFVLKAEVAFITDPNMENCRKSRI